MLLRKLLVVEALCFVVLSEAVAKIFGEAVNVLSVISLCCDN